MVSLVHGSRQRRPDPERHPLLPAHQDEAAPQVRPRDDHAHDLRPRPGQGRGQEWRRRRRLGGDSAQRGVGVAVDPRLRDEAGGDAGLHRDRRKRLGRMLGNGVIRWRPDIVFVQERLPSLHRDFNAARARRGRPADALARGARLLVAVRPRDPRCLRDPAPPAEFRDLQRRLHEPRPRVVLQPRVRGALCRTLSPGLPRQARAAIAAGMASGRRQGPAAARRGDGLRARRRLPGLPSRLDRAGRAEVPQGQAARERRRVGLRPHARRRTDRRRPRRAVALRRLQLHGPRSGVRERDPRPAARRGAAHLRDDPLRRAAVPVRPRGQPHRRPLGERAQAAVHGRKRARLETRRAGPDPGLDGRRAQDLQDADRRAAEPVLGQDARA